MGEVSVFHFGSVPFVSAGGGQPPRVHIHCSVEGPRLLFDTVTGQAHAYVEDQPVSFAGYEMKVLAITENGDTQDSSLLPEGPGCGRRAEA